ncbi:MAG: DUF401 family protein [Phycisphaerae bacterium]|nr:DUF401 family protein [Phycisphaerae bacterium]
MPALLYTLGTFALILVLVRLRVPLAVAILAGAVATGALFGLGHVDVIRALAAGAVKPTTLALLVIIMLILILSQIMQQGGQMEQIVSLARGCLRRPALAMAALPALIGLLPMPGGALFSAPMVDSAAVAARVKPARLSAINYWYRHVWEHWWPLYPGVILAVTLRGCDLWAFIVQQAPLGLLTIVAGLVIFRGVHPDLHAVSPAPPPGTKRKLLAATSSIWIVLIVWAVVRGGMFAAIGSAPQQLPAGPPLRVEQVTARLVHVFVPISLGLLASLIWTVRTSRLGWRQAARILARGTIYKTAALVLSVMVYQYMLGRVGAAEQVGRELTGYHVPVMLVVVSLPFIAGMVTGLAIGFVGTSFPIVLELLTGAGGQVSIVPSAVLAFASGHLGMMLSPLHLCHILSNRYFKTSFGPVYRHLLLAAVIMAVFVAGYFLLLRAIVT